MSKKQIRGLYIRKRTAMEQREFDSWNDQITQYVLDFIQQNGYQRIHIFISIEKLREIDTSKIIGNLLALGKEVIVPKMSQKKIEHCLINHKTVFEENSWGISEPKDLFEIVDANYTDCIIVPLLAYDSKGTRVGYGGGYYDRFLAEVEKEVPKVGVSFFPPTAEDLPAKSFDIPLTHIVSPQGICKF